MKWLNIFKKRRETWPYWVVVGVAMVAGVIFFEWWQSVGLTGEYWIKNEDKLVLVSAEIDKGVNFENVVRLRSPYWNHWQTSLDGFPIEAAKPVVRWRGLVRLPRETEISMESPERVKVVMGGHEITAEKSAIVAAGLAPIEINYESQLKDDKLVLLVKGRPLNPLWLYPSQKAVGRRRISQWALMVMTGIGVIVVVAGWSYEKTRWRVMQMGKLLKEPKVWLMVLVVVGAGLRLYQRGSYPPLHETEDEQGLAWHGISLLTTGVPTSWLFYDYFYPLPKYSYDHLQSLRWFGAGFTLGTPYFDNPPLMPIILGLVSVVAGARTIFDSHLEVIRLVPIVFGIVNIWLVYVWGEKILKSKQVGLLAAGFYSLTPLIVVANRLVKEENMLATFFLLIGLFVDKYLESKRKKYLMWAGLTAGLAFLTKETSAVGLLAALVMVWEWPKKWRLKEVWAWPVVKILAAMTPFVLFYFLYGIPWGIGYLWMSFEVNTQKILDVVSWFRFFTDHYGAAIQSFGFFFYPLMLINLFASSVKMDKFSKLTVSLYLLLMGALIYGIDWGYFGWYKTAMFPFLALGMGVSVVEGMKEVTEGVNYLRRLMVPVITLIAGGYYPLVKWGMTGNKGVVYTIAILGLAYVVAPEVDKRLKHGLTYVMLAVFVVGSIVAIIFQDQFYFMSLKF